MNDKLNVLIIDDNYSDCLVLSTFLEALNVRQIQVAEDASIAVFKIDNAKDIHKPFDLIFLDVFLPKNSGIEVLKYLRNNKKNHDMNIVLISNSFDELKIEKAKEYLVDDILVKPVTLEVLNDKVKAIANRRIKVNKPSEIKDSRNLINTLKAGIIS